MAKRDFIEKMEIPHGVKAHLEKKLLSISGPKGTVKRDFNNPKVQVELLPKEIVFTVMGGSKYDKAVINSYKAHLLNMFKGSQEGFVYKLKVCSGHFPINVSIANSKLLIKNFLGEKVPREVKLLPESVVKIEGNIIVVESVDKEIAGQTSANIEQATRRPGFDKRIFQDGIYLIEKTGRQK